MNFGETGAVELTRLLRSRGVEAGLASASAAHILVQSGLGASARASCSSPGDAELADAVSALEAIEAVLDRAGPDRWRLLHGYEGTAWPLRRLARHRNYATRIGLEDTLVLPMDAPRGTTRIWSVSRRSCCGKGRPTR